MEHRCLSPRKGAVVGGLIAFACSAAAHAWGATGPAMLLALLNITVAAIAWTLASLAISRCYATACALPGR